MVHEVVEGRTACQAARLSRPCRNSYLNKVNRIRLIRSENSCSQRATKDRARINVQSVSLQIGPAVPSGRVARDYQSPIVPLIRQKWFPDPQEVLPILLVKRLLRVYPSPVREVQRFPVITTESDVGCLGAAVNDAAELLTNFKTSRSFFTAVRLPAHGTVPGALTEVEWERDLHFHGLRPDCMAK